MDHVFSTLWWRTWGRGNKWLIHIVIKRGHSSFRTEISLCPFLRRRGVLTPYQKRGEKHLVKNGEWEKETFCSVKAKTLYLLKTMAAIRRLWCHLTSQGNLGFFADDCTECALSGPGCCNHTWYSWRMVSVCSITWPLCAEASCQNSYTDCSSCALANLSDKAEGVGIVEFFSLTIWGSWKLEDFIVLVAWCRFHKKIVDLKHLDAKLRSHQDNEGRMEELLLAFWDPVR